MNIFTNTITPSEVSKKIDGMLGFVKDNDVFNNPFTEIVGSIGYENQVTWKKVHSTIISIRFYSFSMFSDVCIPDDGSAGA